MNILIGLGLTLFVALGIQTFRIGALKEEIASEKAAIASARETAEREARTREAEMADAVRKASDVYAKNLARAQAGAAGALSELDSLRNVIASAGPAPANPASAAGTDDATRARFVVGKLAEAAATVSAAADACENRLSALQDYVRGIASKP